MLDNYVFLGLFFIAALSFPILPLIVARFISPKRPTPIKESTYECGLEVIGDFRVQFKIQYYLYALAFVIFDIEVVFLYPWAVAFPQLGIFALIAMLIFLAILIFSLIYDWRKGALEWI
ncbi:MAG: NAD(P)H-quinone oxidoreductase subunit 3 [Chloroflexaceae bacterium]|nr:NAD(P)H-quinone oxidoreductase subunit 3 [Chloroflexaceae bacterium]NJO06605.1 NAD(P)H-quinone oxidoreductase subunit 3 [Chloroflexaceae bacterium]